MSAPSCPYPALPPPVKVQLFTAPPTPCPYLPDREATLRAVFVGKMPGTVYHDFMDAGFRRAGRVVYQPVCRGCRLCMPIRVEAAKFKPNKSLRRCAKRNADLAVMVDQPELTDEKFDLYRRYQLARHDGKMDDDWDSLKGFLYTSPVRTLEFTYRDAAGRLMAVGICDVCKHSISSVYFYYEPEEQRRALGHFGALTEIDYAIRHNIPHWYVGYWVKGCKTMEYKAMFRPHELLHPDGVWRESDIA